MDLTSVDDRLAAETLAEDRALARRRGMVRKMITNQHDVDDILQDAALCFWASRSGLGEYRQPGAKLFVITRGLTRRFLGMQHRRQFEHRPIVWAATAGNTPDPAQLAALGELRQIIRHSLSGLTAAERDTIILTALESIPAPVTTAKPADILSGLLQRTRQVVGSSLPFLQLRLATAPRQTGGAH